MPYGASINQRRSATELLSLKPTRLLDNYKWHFAVSLEDPLREASVWTSHCGETEPPNERLRASIKKSHMGKHLKKECL